MDISTATMPKLLWLSDAPVPEPVLEAVSGRWRLEPHYPHEPLTRQLEDVSVALVMHSGDAASLARLLETLDRVGAVGLFILPEGADDALSVLQRWEGPFLWAFEDASAVELAAELSAASRLGSVIRRLRSAPSAAEQRGEELGEELRIAANLQRDFLPARLPEVGPVRFSTLFMPAGFVSGDIYDVVRLDETTLGFYVVDAVGHGLPAALLTMFVKKALQTKRISGHSYEIIPPRTALAALNDDICEQNVSGFHFCTAVYGVLDTRSLTLTYARAGHPEALLYHPDGRAETLGAPGGLLGVMTEQPYESRSVRLSPGDRLVLYTDGLEAAFRRQDGTCPRMVDALKPLAAVDRDEVLGELTERIALVRQQQRAELDDTTVVVMDVQR